MRLFILGLVAVLFSAFPAFSETYVNDWYHINLTYSDEWGPVEEQLTQYHLLSLKNNKEDAVINLYGYTYSETVTINGFQERRKASGYDGWRNIAERPAFSHELERVGAPEGYVAIYAKKELGTDLRSINWVVAEYYFVKENKGYVFSVKTTRKNFPKIQDSYKKVLDSFWLGTGPKPSVINRRTNVSDWDMVGKNPQNHNSIDVQFELNNTVKEQWYKPNLGSPEDAYSVFSRGVVIIANGQDLQSISAHDGSENWNYELSSEVRTNLAVYDKYLYVVVGSGDILKLLILDFVKGHVLSEVMLQDSVVSDPVVLGSNLVFVEGGLLVARDLVTGDVKWERDLNVDPNFYPVGYANFLVVVDDSGVLHLIRSQDGEDYWTVTLDYDLQFSPIVTNDFVITPVVRQKGLMKQAGFIAFDVAKGAKVWSYFSDKGDQFTDLLPSKQGDSIYVPLQNSGDKKVLALDINTGAVVWEYVYETNQDYFFPVVTDQYVFLLREEPNEETGDNELKLYNIDNKTGFEVSALSVDGLVKASKFSIRWLMPYKKYMFLFDESDGGSMLALKSEGDTKVVH